MRGINLADQKVQTYSVTPRSNKCIFLSHRSNDKEKVQKIGEYIQKAGYDIYLDMNDPQLQIATSAQNAKAVTGCIQKGISSSNYMICIISNSTFDVNSWWVSYEIGYADKSNIGCSVMQLATVDKIPEFLEIKNVIKKIEDLNILLKSISPTAPRELLEKIEYRSYQNDAILKSSMNHELYGILKTY